MLEFRKMKIEELDKWLDLLVKAYPGFKTPKSKLANFMTTIIEKEEKQDLFGLYDNNELVGGVRLLQFQLNCGGAIVPAGGIGLVAIDILRRREGLAKELMRYCISYFNERHIHIAALYPFETSFYKKIGFGNGVKVSQYKIKPRSFLNKGNKKNVKEYRDHDENRRKLLECYNKAFQQTNGMTERLDSSMDSLFKEGQHVLVYENDSGAIEGFLAFSYQNDAMFITNMNVKEIVYLTPDALHAFCTFFHSQSDQVERIIISSNDDYFRFLADDASNGEYNAFQSVFLETHVTAEGLMYRVLDTKRLLEQLGERNFGGLNGQLKLTVSDSFLKENNESVCAIFKDGVVEVSDEAEPRIELRIDMSEFSSLIMGAVDVNALLRLGLASISEQEAANTVSRLFASDSKPVSNISY